MILCSVKKKLSVKFSNYHFSNKISVKSLEKLVPNKEIRELRFYSCLPVALGFLLLVLNDPVLLLVWMPY
jgi:hypothetical protein